MSKNTIKTLTTTAVIGLASAGVPAFAQEANSDVATATSVNEPALVEKQTIEKSSDVKPALDAQKKVVEKTKEQLTDAQTKAHEANKQVSNAQTAVDKATEDVKHAEEVASKATPQNIEANKADQKANLADQEANAKETATADANIATQADAVSKAQTDEANAEQALKDANADVSAKETQVKSAKDAISGTGLAQAEDKLDEAKAETKGAEKNVSLADTTLTDAKKADEKRQEAIDNAQSDVDAKTTLVNDAKDNLESATTKANGATTTLSQAEDKLDKATKALDSVDIVKIPNLTQFKEDIASGDNDFITDSGAKAIENTETSIGKNAKSQPVDIDNLTQAQKEEISHLYVQGLKQVREQLKDNSKYLVTSKENTGVTKEAIELATSRAREYEQRGKSPLTHGHIGAGVENLERLGSKDDFKSMYDLKEAVVKALLGTSFDDAHSNWGHLKANLNFAKNVGLDIANINGDYWLVIAFSNKGTSLVNPTNAEAIQKAYEDAKAEKDTAQTASEKANDALKQASADYASALELKTSAEKTLADATATPIQTQVAENNLRLAKLALDSAQKRQAEAQKAVDNFSADLASKKQALDDAKSALESAKRVQEQKVQALSDSKTELTKQESKLEALKTQKAKLIEEKDRLVKEAKALAEELKGYVEAPINLAKAKDKLAEKQNALKDAETKAQSAKNLVEVITSTLEAEQTKLDEIQTKYEKLQDLEEKAKDNVIATLPDGTIVAVPKGTPVSEERPEIDIKALKEAIASGKDIEIIDGKVIVRATKPISVEHPKTSNDKSKQAYTSDKNVTIDNKGNVVVNGQTYTSKQQASSKPIYSRVERAKSLPNTGESSSVAMLVLGAILGAFGLVTVRRKN
ncbi:SEC10/PgrA surface exclusion domain-containing protein [Streptococcus infantis]|uniref:SEC10/PgrA surface exclusion domain-containing protein n=1 Tax=Streptococcus infantis TaxID=68892 RepID=UPI001CBF711C|nr:SEC10/PgrA surface exclusion domain-containing protein [Streptococcus infantis]MBZ2120093.1 SEC10/PgrA surface exclusion domain-containing protein [Streptococcus infantis]MBZ2121912.1 SEC10/PgrA surface exclusion domain-containing protein [Streptococcus infantis]MBZ2125817.1 SEC10/PgrA surface exclusion domain-containing protein [Streptococcus infantis]